MCVKIPVTREVKLHVYVKRQTRICMYHVTKFPLHLSFLISISTHKLVVSRNFVFIGIVLNRF